MNLTTKRILSILLSIICALSVFTLLAFASDSELQNSEPETSITEPEENTPDTEEKEDNNSFFNFVEPDEYLDNLIIALKQAGRTTVRFPAIVGLGFVFVPALFFTPLVLLVDYFNVFRALIGLESNPSLFE